MNRKRILGITALFAVLAMCLTFTACPPDEEERIVSFYNASAAKIELTCPGSTPSKVILEKANSTAEEAIFGPVDVTRKGKDIEIASMAILNYSVPLGDEFDYITARGGVAIGKNKGIKAGSVIFEAVKLNGIIPWKVDTIPLDE